LVPGAWSSCGYGRSAHRRAGNCGNHNWRQDIAYLASHLPQVRVDGLGTIGDAAWQAAAERLEAKVPRLSKGQVIVSMARMIAALHDDESRLQIPPGPVCPLDAEWFGGRLYLVGVPTADRPLLGARLVAVDGHPIAGVMASIASVIDYQDPALLAATQAGIAGVSGSLEPTRPHHIFDFIICLYHDIRPMAGGPRA
jgi:hypothetical protein